MWVDALDRMMAHCPGAELDLDNLRAIAGSAQQHGGVSSIAGGRRLAIRRSDGPLRRSYQPALQANRQCVDATHHRRSAGDRRGAAVMARGPHRVAGHRALHRPADSPVFQQQPWCYIDVAIISTRFSAYCSRHRRAIV
jgi:hypothetical protein